MNLLSILKHNLIVFLCCHATAGLAESEIKFPDSFLFGLATAPAHVEDQLDDTWAQFAEDGYVAAFDNTPNPLDRLLFWTQPEIEIKEAAQTGVGLYRFGIDWHRLAPHLPGSFECPDFPNSICPEGIQDFAAWRSYRDRHFVLLKSKKLQIMLTLFHHSAPRWFMEKGGWSHRDSVKHFLAFVESLLKEMEKTQIEVAYWTTLNEPVLFSMMTYALKVWPNTEPQQGWEKLTDFFSGKILFPEHSKAVANLIKAHNEAYTLIKKYRPSQEKVGYAQNIGLYSPANPKNPIKSTIEKIIVNFARHHYLFNFFDATAKNVDFFGVNYYGEEFISTSGIVMRPDRPYSDSGRSINPSGFYEVISEINKRFDGKIPFFITENGIADSTDMIRPAYLLEHLVAIHALIQAGVEVLGYNFWTLTDNWEWSDGYCPRFGLMEVDRHDPNLKNRHPRINSYPLFLKIVANQGFSKLDRDLAWQKAESMFGQAQPLCRNPDGVSSADEPNFNLRQYPDYDWRFRAK